MEFDTFRLFFSQVLCSQPFFFSEKLSYTDEGNFAQYEKRFDLKISDTVSETHLKRSG